MKKKTLKWLRIWGLILCVPAGFITLGYTWGLLAAYIGDEEDFWELYFITAFESWLTWWRGILIVLAGFPTLGYAWVFWSQLTDRTFWFLDARHKYEVKEG
ncbi:hypothetical protein ES703_95766 [subsurface metagenome]